METYENYHEFMSYKNAVDVLVKENEELKQQLSERDKQIRKEVVQEILEHSDELIDNPDYILVTKIIERIEGEKMLKQILLQQVTIKDIFNNKYIYDKVYKYKVKKGKLHIYSEANDTKSYFCFDLKKVLVFSIREEWYDVSVKF